MKMKPILLLTLSLALLPLVVGSVKATALFAAWAALACGLVRLAGPRLRRRSWLWGITAAQSMPLVVAKAFPAALPLPLVPATIFTLQAASVLWESAGELPPALDYLLFLLYVPKFFSGPIERFRDFAPQARAQGEPVAARVKPGLYLIASGLYKKQIVALALAPVLAAHFGHPRPSGPVNLLIAYLCTFEFFAFFSGYTDVARGVSRLAGIRLTPNFLCPFFCTDLQDFWHRWHWSFSRWLRDYVFYPSFFLLKSVVLSILAAFLAMGILDGVKFGAGLPPKYLVLGLYCGFAMVAYVAAKPVLARWEMSLGPGGRRWYRLAGSLAVFHFFCVAAVLQRPPDLGYALQAARALPIPNWGFETMALLRLLAAVAVPLLLLDAVLWRRGADEDNLRGSDLAFSGAVMGLGYALFAFVPSLAPSAALAPAPAAGGITVEGRIDAPEALRAFARPGGGFAVVAGPPGVMYSPRLYYDNIFGPEEHAKVEAKMFSAELVPEIREFPFRFRFTIPESLLRAWREEFPGSGVDISFTYCLGPASARNDCPVATPRLRARSRIAPGASAASVDLGDLYFTRHFHRGSAAALRTPCREGDLNGNILATKAFLAHVSAGERYAYVFRTFISERPPAEVRSDPGPDVFGAGFFAPSAGGTAYRIPLRSLRVPGYIVGYVVRCEPGESLRSCAGKTEEVPKGELNDVRRRSFYLVPAGLTYPHCADAGEKNFYLHWFPEAPAKAEWRPVGAGQPGELLEGQKY